jgi:hypothetical protein
MKVSDVSDRKLILREPKSAKESEVAFMPEKIAKRLPDYMQQEGLSPEDQIFSFCYSTARARIQCFLPNSSIPEFSLQSNNSNAIFNSGLKNEAIFKGNFPLDCPFP